MPFHRQPHIDLVLSRMNMKAGIQRMGNFSAAFQCSCSKRHQCVHAEQCRHLPVTGLTALTNPTLVFLNSLAFTIAIRYLVAETAAQSHIPEGPLDLIETAINAGRRGVVVNNRGAACPGRVHQGQQGRVVNIIRIQRHIEFPPQLRECLLEISCR